MSEKREVKRIEIFRFDEGSGSWKKVYLEPTDGGAFLVVSQGVKGKNDKVSVSLKLSFAELSLLRMALDKIILKYLDI